MCCLTQIDVIGCWKCCVEFGFVGGVGLGVDGAGAGRAGRGAGRARSGALCLPEKLFAKKGHEGDFFFLGEMGK